MKTTRYLLVLFLTMMLSGCIAYTVIETAVYATTTVVGGAVGVVDAVTPDVFSDEDDDKNNDQRE